MLNIRECRQRLTWALLSGALLLTLGCGDDAAPPSVVHHTPDAGDGESDAASIASLGACADSGIGVLRLAAWPGAGVQLAISSADADGEPRSGLSAKDFSLKREDGERIELALREQPQRSGLTALLIVPSADPEQHALRLRAARALVEALPAEERIAVFVAVGGIAPGLALASELSEQHAHVVARLAAIEAAPASMGDAEPLNSAVDRVALRLAGVSEPWGPLARTLVVVGAALPDTQAERGAQLQVSLAAPEQVEADGSDWDPALSAQLLAQRIAAQRDATVLLGACGPFAAGEPLLLELGAARCTLQAPTPIVELAGAACDASAAAEDAYPFADVIDLVLTPEELAKHDEFDAAQTEDEFSLQVVLGDAAPIDATAHFRGQTSLECARKNYSINLQGSRARRIAPGIAGDEFFLISMCKEDAYFRQVVASRMMGAVGLFPLDQRYVRLRVAGRERGVYLLLEKPADTLLADNLALTAVVRRRLDATNTAPEVKYPSAPEAVDTALAHYAELAATVDDAAPEDLADALDQQLDLDGYLHWLAINSYLHNGDSSDEAFFYASDESGTPGAGWYFRHVAWDGDDLFKTCHHDGQYAHQDEAGLSYCAESDLDRALMRSPAVYERFVDLFQALISERLSEEAVAALLDQTRSELFAQLQDDAVCGAMVELIAHAPDGVRCDAARAYIDSEMDVFRSELHARAQELQTAIDTWKAQP